MQLVSDGSLSTVPLTIKFFEQSHISVYVNDVALPTAGYSYVWSGATTVTITPAVAAGVNVSIRRNTPDDYVLHDFQAGAVFSEVSVDENFQQNLFLLQEAEEQSFVTDLFDTLDMHGNNIRNVAAAVLPGDATRLDQVQAMFTANGLDPTVRVKVREALRKLYALAGFTLVAGSFEAGGTLRFTTDALLHEATGVAYTWSGVYPLGGYVVTGGTLPSSSASFVSTANAATRTFPETYTQFAASITAAVQLAADNGTVVDMSGRDWKINSTINWQDGTTVLLGSSNIEANTGATPLFTYNVPSGVGITIEAGSGIITGTASAFLSCTGLSFTPTNADYVKQVRIRGVHVSSSTIERGLHLVGAVRQIFLDSCMLYVRNGIVANGKIVEMKGHKCIIYGAGSGLDTVGVQSISPGGTNFYSEGWHFTDCTIDNFENTFDIRDIFVLTVMGGFIGCNSATGLAFRFGGRTTTHCREINIDTVIGGRIEFVSEPVGWLVNAKINGIQTRVNGGIAFRAVNNASGIDVGLTFESLGGGAGCAVVGNNCSNIVFSGISTDASPAFGVQFTGASGAGCGIDGFIYRGAGQALFTNRPVLRRGIVSGVAADVAYSQTSAFATAGNFAVGAAIMSCTMSVAKGERGMLAFNLAYAGANAATQNLQLQVPAGIVIPSAPGHSAANTLVSLATGMLSKTVPFYATSDVALGAFTLNNQAGNTITINSHSMLSVVLT